MFTVLLTVVGLVVFIISLFKSGFKTGFKRLWMFALTGLMLDVALTAIWLSVVFFLI